MNKNISSVTQFTKNVLSPMRRAVTTLDVPDSCSQPALGSGSATGGLSAVSAIQYSITDIRSKELLQGDDHVLSHVVNAAKTADVPNALMAIDLGQVTRQADRWGKVFPNVAPFYAVKSLPDPAVIATLAANGVNFDCASSSEIDAVLSAGVSADRIIFANPCKFPADIEHARSCGIRKMTFDNDDELEKVASIFPAAELVLRIVTDDSASVCRLSNKYGAAIEDCTFLLKRAHDLGLNVVGVSFHVGSGASNADAFVDALSNARIVFDKGLEVGFRPFTLLDIGGGFPGDDSGSITIAEIAGTVNSCLNQLFPDDAVKVIAEPGRFFSHSAATLAARIIGRRVVRNPLAEDPEVLYYIGDGIYGSFNCMLYDHYTPAVPIPVATDSQLGETRRSRVFGPTCDGLDTLFELTMLPQLRVGDWLVFKNMGAYTICAASHFNGLQKPQIEYIRS